MLNKIKNLSNTEDKKRLLSNFFSLSVLQAANYILPLITLPYLIRVIGVEYFGLLTFSYATVSYLSILTDYGFNLTATREISIHRDNKAKVIDIFSSVMSIKVILMFVSFILLTILVFSFEKFSKDALVYFLTFGIVVGQVLFPVWFFQGMEKMRYITLITVCTKLVFTALVFVLIVSEDDYYIAPLLVSIGSIINGLIAILVVAYKFRVNIYIPSFKVLWSQLSSSVLYFTSRIANNGSGYIATTVIGLYFGNTLVGYYSLVEKIFYAFTSIGGIISQVLYPYVSRTHDLLMLRKVFIRAMILSTIMVLLLVKFNEELLSLVFDVQSEVASKMFRVVFVGAVMNIASSILGFPVLGALGFGRQANTSLVYAALVLIPYLALAIFLSADIIFFASTLVVYSIVGLALRLFFIKRLVV